MTLEPVRSLLFVPADRERFLEKALGLEADAVLLDLEDGVPDTGKAAARATAAAWAGRFRRPVWIRVNGPASGHLEADLDALVGVPGVTGLMLPKAERRSVLDELDATITRLEQERPAHPGTARRPLAVIAQVESALGVLAAFELASAPRVVSLCLGGARGGDLQADLGADWSIDGPELLYARQHVLLAARAAGVAWPLDGVFADVADPAGFERDTVLSRRLGYRGRTVIHPGQIPTANRTYRPSPAEIDGARRIVDAFRLAEANGRATTVVDGRLVDVAMVRHAHDVLRLGERFPPEPTD